MNLEARPEASIVIFDSSAPIGTGQAVYMSATARQLGDDELAEQIDVFSRRSLSHGTREWTPEDVHQPARLRLYRATAVEQYVLDERDSRVSVTP